MNIDSLVDLTVEKNKASKYIDFSPMKGLKNEFLIKLGDAYVNDKRLNSAFEIYKQTRNKEKLIEIGNRYIEEGGYLIEAIEARKLGGKEITKKEFIEMGDRLVENGKLGFAVDAYEMAMDELSKEKLIEIGDKCLKGGYFEEGIKFYKSAGEEVSDEEIIDSAEALIEKKPHYAFVGYKLTENPEKTKIVKARDAYLKKGFLEYAIELNKLIGEKSFKKEVIKAADSIIENGENLNYVTKIYKLIGEEIPKEKLIKSIDAFILKENYFDTNEICKLVKDEISNEKIIEIGDLCVKKKDISNAIKAYKLAGKENLSKFLKQFIHF